MLLQTKLHRPRPRDQRVSRPRLLARLNAGLTGKLTLVAAPAGFGKTTLLAHWLAQRAAASKTAVWLSLDADDNDPQRFFTYVAAAVAPLPGVGQSLPGLLQSPQPLPPKALVTALTNDLTAVSQPAVLVLDDYHVIENAALDEALALLLDHMPSPLHLVVASRTDPPWPLARLRAQGQLNELRQADLRFTIEESARFLHQLTGLELSADDVSALVARTEGWAAGLQLAALALPGNDDLGRFIQQFGGSHRYVIDYLTQEVLRQQPPPVQDFLLQTAVLNRFCAPLCDAVAETGDWQSDSQGPPPGSSSRHHLDYLEQHNLFLVPLDDERRWYRYHHLFADVLRHRLQQSQPERVPLLHRRAGAWLAAHGLMDEAIHHTLQGADYGQAARLIGQQAERAWQQGQLTRLQAWLDALPPAQETAHPGLGLFAAWNAMVGGDYQATVSHLDTADRAIDTAATAAATAAWQGKTAVVRAFMATFGGQTAVTIEQAQQALKLLPPTDAAWRSSAAVALGDAHAMSGDVTAAAEAYQEAMSASRRAGNSYLTLNAGFKLTAVLAQQGRLQEAAATARRQLQLARERDMAQTAMAGCLHAFWGQVLCQWNRLDEADSHIERGVTLCRQGGHVGMLGWSYLCQMRLRFAQGDLGGVDAILQQLRALGPEDSLPPWIRAPLAVVPALMALKRGDLAAATDWAQGRAPAQEEASLLRRELEQVTLARVWLAQGKPDGAMALLTRLQAAAQARGRVATAIEVLNLQAMTLAVLGEEERKTAVLGQSLALARPGGFIRPFVDEGPPMARLLADLQPEDDVHAGYIRELLAAFAEEDITPSPSLADPLSERELEVLRLIADGLKNKEIAEALFISPNTVAYHTKNIYSKLQVHKRTQAVVRARDLKLL